MKAGMETAHYPSYLLSALRRPAGLVDVDDPFALNVGFGLVGSDHLQLSDDESHFVYLLDNSLYMLPHGIVLRRGPQEPLAIGAENLHGLIQLVAYRAGHLQNALQTFLFQAVSLGPSQFTDLFSQAFDLSFQFFVCRFFGHPNSYSNQRHTSGLH